MRKELPLSALSDAVNAGTEEMSMDDQPTCGKGLAEHSALPAKLGALTAAMGEVLEVHMKALDLKDANAREEHEAYRQLAKELRSIAAQLQVTAMKMTACRNLPMGRHDEKVMSGREALHAFKRFVKLEQELLALLETRLERDRQMLAMMEQAGASSSLPPIGARP